MCGIAGLFRVSGDRSERSLGAAARSMADALVHRGPDDDGVYAASRDGLAFGFRRLSIQDVSDAGKQPMLSASRRYAIVFNGEIYNFREIRRELEKAGVGEWRGRSDTEVLLAAIEAWGLDRALEAVDGMFAFALHDARTRRLILARDRMGEKPLYYGWIGREFRFASELKAIVAAGREGVSLDTDAVAGFITFGYVPTPLSILSGIRKLPHGAKAELPLDAAIAGCDLSPVRYWRARDRIGNETFAGDPAAAAATLEDLLRGALAQRAISDRPLGCFFSGGIDSTAIVALMADQHRDLDTFTIGFEDERFDEAPWAAEIARHLGVRNHAQYVTGKDMLGFVGGFADLFDEPFGDVSALPTLALSRFTRDAVTVALSGDGGDELFGGYDRYFRIPARWRERNALRRLFPELPYGWLNRVSGCFPRPGRWGDKAMRARGDRRAPDIETLHRFHVSRWRLADRPVREKVTGYFASPDEWPDAVDPQARVMFADSQSYLPDDLLVKIDRASMAHSLEVRAPLLAREVVEFAWRLPGRLKLGPDGAKLPLRAILRDRIPPALLNRPKSGFEPPLAEWLRSPLRDWAETLIRSLEIGPLADGVLDPRPVRALWEEHQARHRNWHFEVWNVLVLADWRRRWRV